MTAPLPTRAVEDMEWVGRDVSKVDDGLAVHQGGGGYGGWTGIMTGKMVEVRENGSLQW